MDINEARAITNDPTGRSLREIEEALEIVQKEDWKKLPPSAAQIRLITQLAWAKGAKVDESRIANRLEAGRIIGWLKKLPSKKKG